MLPELTIYGPNATSVTVKDVTLYFSYTTCIAFRSDTERLQTDIQYSRTTSKHKSLMGVKEWKAISLNDFNHALEMYFT